jgi:DNA-binding IclR family transcriptional regulator
MNTVAKAATSELSSRETGTIARTVMVLRAIAQARQAPTMKELADAVNLPMSTMHRLLDLLAEEGMVDRDEATRTFRPGFEFFRLASLVVHRMPLQEVAKPVLELAAREADETAYLGILDARAGKLLFSAQAQSRHMLDYRVPMNEPYALATGASGLAVLAWLPPAQIASVLASESHAGGAEFERTLADVRRRGYANTFGQRVKGAVGFFAPVFNAQENVCASFGYTVPQARYDARARDRLSGLAMRYAGELSRRLGYQAEYPRPAPIYDTANPNNKANA